MPKVKVWLTIFLIFSYKAKHCWENRNNREVPACYTKLYNSSPPSRIEFGVCLAHFHISFPLKQRSENLLQALQTHSLAKQEHHCTVGKKLTKNCVIFWNFQNMKKHKKYIFMPTHDTKISPKMSKIQENI